MKRIQQNILIALGCLITAIVFGCILTTPIHADGEYFGPDYFKKQTSVANLYKCYNAHMESPIDLSNYKGPASLTKDDGAKVAGLPDYLYYDNTSPVTLSCRELFSGSGSYRGVISGISVPDGTSGAKAQDEFLTKLGYKSSGSQGVKCGRITFNATLHLGFATEMRTTNGGSQLVQPGETNHGMYYSPEFCADVDASGKTTTGVLSMGGGGYFEFRGTQIAPDEDTNPFSCGTDNSGLGCTGMPVIQCSAGQDFNQCLQSVGNQFKDHPAKKLLSDDQGGQNYWYYTSVGTTQATSTDAGTSYSLDGNSGKTAAQNLFGSTRNSFTVAERVSLYQIYLNHDASAMICNVPDEKKSEVVGTSYIDKPVHLVVNGKTWNNCYVQAPDKKYNGFDGANWFTEVSLGQILDFLASNPVDSTWASDVVSANATIYNEDEDGGGIAPGADSVPDDDVSCYNAGGALGWILCPIISFVKDSITAIYESIISNFLDVNANYFEFGGSVYGAWQTFQSFANIIFVAIFLITIFSQVTGFGIDNLGIKRILPKLIVAAILINLSYIICQLMVDLSNILGVGLNNLFANIPINTSFGEEGSKGYALSGAVTTAVGGAVGALAVGTFGLWGAVIIIPLFLGLLTTLFGILFFFVILGARQAFIIILIVVSPIAFACYMLPNTKSIFNRWFKAFEALLLVYPICGALMGGSAFASNVLMTLDTGFLGKLIAMLVGVVPFFFIPTILRNSMNAVGNIGARISGFGQGMGRRLTGAIGGSDTVKDMQARARAGIDANGQPTRLAQFRARMAQGDSRLTRIPGIGGIMQRANYRANARSNAARMKYLDEMRREDRLNDPAFFEQYERSQKMALEKEELNTAIDNINKDTNKGENETELFARYDRAVASGNTMEARAIAEIAGRRKDTANRFIEKFKTDSASGVYEGRGDLLESVAKQISTGDGSKNYRAGNAMGFEYASQITQGSNAVKGANGGTMNYGQWSSNTKNVHDAIDHHVTNGAELYGQSKKSIEELGDRASDSDKRLLAELATRAQQEGREGGTYDITKEKALDKLQEGFNTGAQPGGVFNVRGGGHAMQSDRPTNNGPILRAANGAPISTRRISTAEQERLQRRYRERVGDGTASIGEMNALDKLDQAQQARKNEEKPNNSQA